MDKDRPRDVMRSPYRDMGKGEKIRHIISYSNLTSALQDRINELDLDVHDLLTLIIIQVKQINLHLRAMSDEDFTEDDVEWP